MENFALFLMHLRGLVPLWRYADLKKQSQSPAFGRTTMDDRGMDDGWLGKLAETAFLWLEIVLLQGGDYDNCSLWSCF
jgi:hypothetical protein